MEKHHLSRLGPRIILGLIAVIVIAAIFLALRAPPIDVDVAKVVKAPLLVTIDDEGETRIRDIYMVAAPISGELQRINLDPGDPVVAGQTVVARIMPAQPDFLNPRSEAETRAQIRSEPGIIGGSGCSGAGRQCVIGGKFRAYRRTL